MSVYQTSLVPKLIYVFGIADATHEHCLKIGDATIEEEFDFSPNSKTLNDAAHKRIRQYTRTFLGIGAFDEKSEAEACLKYIKTRFARALLGTLKVTQDNPRETWANVPLQDVTSNSDIDWSKSIDEIDAQLNFKYKLNADEVAFIRTHVRAME